MTATSMAPTMAERRADRLAREQRIPKDPLAGTICDRMKRSPGVDRRGNSSKAVEITSWYRKGSATLVARRVGDGIIEFVPESVPTPLVHGPETEPMVRFKAGRGPTAPLNILSVTDSGRTKKYGPPRPPAEDVPPATGEDLRAQVSWLMRQAATVPPIDPPAAEPVEPPSVEHQAGRGRGPRRRRTERPA